MRAANISRRSVVAALPALTVAAAAPAAAVSADPIVPLCAVGLQQGKAAHDAWVAWTEACKAARAAGYPTHKPVPERFVAGEEAAYSDALAKWEEDAFGIIAADAEMERTAHLADATLTALDDAPVTSSQGALALAILAHQYVDNDDPDTGRDLLAKVRAYAGDVLELGSAA